jgi:2-methylcitrate dehydratase
MLDDYDGVIAALTRRILDAPPLAGAAADDSQGDDRLALIHALARLFEAQQSHVPAACLGPLLPGATLVGGARVPGTSVELEPSQAAYCVAWLCGDAPIGALLPLADYLARRAVLTGVRPLRLAALLRAAAQARAIASTLVVPPPHDAPEIAAPLALRVALAGVAARLLGASDAELAAALALAFAEGLAPHEPGSPRACAVAASAAVRIALLARAGAPGPAHILTHPVTGLQDALLGGGVITLREAPPAETARDPLVAWHRFELAVRGRFNERQATRVLAAVHADAVLEGLPLQSFVALLVRPS